MDLDLKTWKIFIKWLLKFSQVNCKVMHKGHKNCQYNRSGLNTDYTVVKWRRRCRGLTLCFDCPPPPCWNL